MPKRARERSLSSDDSSADSPLKAPASRVEEARRLRREAKALQGSFGHDDLELRQPTAAEAEPVPSDMDFGYTIDGFSLESDLKEGVFTSDGDFVWRRPEKEADAWVADLAAVEPSQPKTRTAALAEPEEISVADAVSELIALLPDEETTPTQLLQRFREPPGGFDLRKKNKQKPAGIAPEHRSAFARVTTLCHSLLTQTGSNAYDLVRRQLASLTASAGHWQFRWRESPGVIHGPADTEQMDTWRREGFWRDRRAEVRRVTVDGEPVTKWLPAEEFVSFDGDALPFADDADVSEDWGSAVEAATRMKRPADLSFMNVL